MNTLEFNSELFKLEKGLRGFALKLTGNQNEALDLYQEMVYRALKGIHQFRKDTNLKAWLMTIMRNSFINIYRRKKKKNVLQDGSINNYLLNSANTSVNNQGELKVDYEELAAIVDQLDDHLRIPFWLSFNGYKYAEIAEELNVPIGTIKSRVFVARKRIQKSIKRLYKV